MLKKKDVIKILISEYLRIISNIRLIERDYEMEDGLNYVFVGLRRSGNTQA